MFVHQMQSFTKIVYKLIHIFPGCVVYQLAQQANINVMRAHVIANKTMWIKEISLKTGVFIPDGDLPLNSESFFSQSFKVTGMQRWKNIYIFSKSWWETEYLGLWTVTPYSLNHFFR